MQNVKKVLLAGRLRTIMYLVLAALYFRTKKWNTNAFLGHIQPPPGVDLVTTALLIMIKLEKKNFSWDNAKKMMAKVDAFKEQLEEYRGEDIPEVCRTPTILARALMLCFVG